LTYKHKYVGGGKMVTASKRSRTDRLDFQGPIEPSIVDRFIVEPPDPYEQLLAGLPDLRELYKQIQEEFPEMYNSGVCEHLMLTLNTADEEATPVLYLGHHIGQTIPLRDISHPDQPQVPYYGIALIFSKRSYQGQGTFEGNFVPELERIAQEESPVIELTALSGQTVLHTMEPSVLIDNLPGLLRQYSGMDV
jgi:hypothetical protein